MDKLPFATSLFGAACGALGALGVGVLKERRDERRRRHTALLHTQYALYSQWGILEDIRRNLLEPVRAEQNRFLKMKQYFRVTGELRVPFDELTFVLESTTPNLLQEIHVAERYFLNSVNLLDQVNTCRRALHSKHAPEEFNMATGVGTTVAPAHEIFDLKSLTDLFYDQVDRSLPEIKKVNSTLFTFIKANFKGKKAAQFVPIANEATPNPKVNPASAKTPALATAA
ncbi:MAG: hypothetical protein ACXWC8_17175 [Limisphaerales bacterium]